MSLVREHIIKKRHGYREGFNVQRIKIQTLYAPFSFDSLEWWSNKFQEVPEI